MTTFNFPFSIFNFPLSTFHFLDAEGFFVEGEADVAVFVFGYLGEGVVHQFVALGCIVVESPSGKGGVGEFRCTCLTGPRVARKVDVVESVVGWNDGHALVVSVDVDGVELPGIAVVIDVEDDEAMSVEVLVPSFQLTVFEQVVFVLVPAVSQDVGDGLRGDGGHIGDEGWFGKFDGLQPSAKHALVAGEACWRSSFAIVLAVVHDVP